MATSGRASGYQQNRNDSHDHWSSTDPDEMTLEVVDEFKRCIQNKTERGQHVHQSIVELEIFKIRRNKNPDQFDLDRWKSRLPDDVRNCPDTILRLSMAYGDDPQELKHVLKAKMMKTNSIDNPPDVSLDNIKQPLQRLQSELYENVPPNIFQAVRNIDDRHIDRANRLFLSEIHSYAPSLQGYTIDDARKAVQAIRETSAPLNKPDDLLPIIKTFREVEDIRDYIQKPSKHRDSSPHLPSTTTTTSLSTSNDQHRPNIHPSTNDRDRTDQHRPNIHSGTTDRNQTDNHRSNIHSSTYDRNQTGQHRQNIHTSTNDRNQTDNYRPDIHASNNDRNQADRHRANIHSSTNDRNQRDTNSSLSHQQPQTPLGTATRRDEPAPTRFADDDHRTNVPPVTNYGMPNHGLNPNFLHKPVIDPYKQSSQKSSDESAERFRNRDSERNN